MANKFRRQAYCSMWEHVRLSPQQLACIVSRLPSPPHMRFQPCCVPSAMQKKMFESLALHSYERAFQRAKAEACE